MDRIMAVTPKKAATVILLKDDELQRFDVFLLKRHEKSSFMGGNYVYPGGRVDRGDGSSGLSSLSRGVTFEEAQKNFGGTLSPEESLAHWIAAIRELFEEAGVLLAYDQKGNLVELTTGEERERFSHHRKLLQEDKISFSEMAQKEKLLFALDQLHYYAHWITPEAQPQRFDTRFFLARCPSGQEASPDQKETTDGIWLPPWKALEENLKGNVVLSPPTLKTLEDLSRFKTLNHIFLSLKKNDIQPVLPILTRISDDVLIVFPWDPEYNAFQKGKGSSPVHHGSPSRQGDNTTRLLMKEGRWLPYCRE